MGCSTSNSGKEISPVKKDSNSNNINNNHRNLQQASKSSNKNKKFKTILWKNKAGVEWKLKKVTDEKYECIDCPYPNSEFTFKYGQEKNRNKNIDSFLFLDEKY
jgi:hypothetical protein